MHNLFRSHYGKTDGRKLCWSAMRVTSFRGRYTIAKPMQTSSNPAPLVSTSLVNSRKKTTVPATSVNASTIVFVRMPAGEALSIAVG